MRGPTLRPRAARPQEAAAPRDRVLPPRLFFYRPDDFLRSALARQNQIQIMFEVRRVRQDDVPFVLMRDKRQQVFGCS
jgi:hypothetical protein